MVSIEENIFEQVLASGEFLLALAVCRVYLKIVCSVPWYSVRTYLHSLYYIRYIKGLKVSALGIKKFI